MKIQIIIGSTRDNRRGDKVGKWVFEQAEKREGWEVELLDLKEWDLPMYNEPHPPKAEEWKAKIAEADGYIIVTPEYNHGYPASLKNALDYPYDEWARKAIGLVGYARGGFGGARSVEQLKPVGIELQMAVVPTSFYVSRVGDAYDESGNIKDPKQLTNLNEFFDDLDWWTKALKNAREKT
ncbi:MAG: Flavoprotein [Candidatus Daviesbacteria bacterium GW2011_GWA2_38_24]|uniref:Flavoprotein n=1 Tax=Candidatus Daviesbacteria bacterium GW2011_GWA2_38_24 TaxID=1618422 RepID=A0A0G0JE72_9BACT|nr:MAG: Flavoprotein [Candidatus Daviesbacteria bacterium GW2011_GWA2_38_24]KKQ80858.1 MAG: Flavoprotein [Candidatus Daviesbacteria bacterium GW2011_GWA1_38_7]